MQEEMVERRKFMRFNTTFHATFKSPKGKTEGNTEIRNLSRGGLSMLIDQGLHKGTEVGLNMNVPGDNVPIFANARVAWSRKASVGDKDIFRAGLKFTKIDNFDRARLLDYVYSQWLKMLKNV